MDRTQTSGPPAGGPARGAVRQLGLFTVLCIGVNNIVGAGIYVKPRELAAELGAASWIAFASDGLLLVTVALCFAAMSARHDEAGGPYLYATRAFGRWVGFAVAWTAWISMWAAVAAVATAVPGYLAVFVPAAGSPRAAAAIGLLLVVAFGAVNCVGVKPAAGTATLLTLAKLLPLAAFVGVGILHVDWERVAAVPASFDEAGRAAFGRALFAAFYPLQGFEVVPVPAAELRNPRRDVPLAVTIALVASAAIYCLVQVVAVGTLPGLASVDGARPLAAAAGTFLGSGGERLMAAGACVSMLGFTAVTMLCAPRFLVALGRDGLLPAAFARHSARFGTPLLAVAATTLAALFGALFCVVDALGGEQAFARLTNLSNLAVLVQYTTTCLAVIALRAHAPAGPLGFRLPGGRFAVPLLGLCACAFLLVLTFLDASWPEQIAVFAAWIAVGIALALSARAARAAGAASPPA